VEIFKFTLENKGKSSGRFLLEAMAKTSLYFLASGLFI
jgi:hypothetical protein